MVFSALMVRKRTRFVTRVAAGHPAMVAWLPMALVTDAVPEIDGNYGWCGLCHSFTTFPHECPGEDRPAPEGPS